MLVLIKGAGDLATGTAVRLYRAGIKVVMTEVAQPTAVRRTVAFSQCMYDGAAQVEGISARRAEDAGAARRALERGEVPVLCDPEAAILRELSFDGVVDAILAKRNLGTAITDAPVVLALGPGFTAGVDCHGVVETMRGHNLGRLLTQGSAAPNTGVPGDVGGYTTQRIIRAPADGAFEPLAAIGLRPAHRRGAGDAPRRAGRHGGHEGGGHRPPVPGGALLHRLRQGPCHRRRRAGGAFILWKEGGSMERLILCGGGHVSLEVAHIARRLEFELVVIDDRPEFASRERFSMAGQVVCAPFLEALDALGSRESDYYVILTRGHAHDRDCLEHVLRGKYAYAGMIGSRTKVAAVKAALEAAGIAREILDGVHSPIGLSIGAQTPAEIAVSIAAELVQERARRGPAAAPPAAGEPGVLCTITAKRGSAPRNVGTWMLVRPDGSVLGTIGGGAVEHLAVQEAKALWAHGGGPVRRHYDLTPGAAELGMVCGGDIDVEFEVRK